MMTEILNENPIAGTIELRPKCEEESFDMLSQGWTSRSGRWSRAGLYFTLQPECCAQNAQNPQYPLYPQTNVPHRHISLESVQGMKY